MNLYGLIFYLLALLVLIATSLAITRMRIVHSIVYLIISFLGTALLFYLLGAPFLAALEVIIYAGAIMVLFLFIVMMIRLEPAPDPPEASLRQWWPGIILGLISFVSAVALVSSGSIPRIRLKTAMASPQEFGQSLFKSYWFPIEIASFLLLIALVGALYLGRREGKRDANSTQETS